MNYVHGGSRNTLEIDVSHNSSNASTFPTAHANNTGRFDFYVQPTTPLPVSLDPLQEFCNAAISAPNPTVCCDTHSGLW